MPAPRAVGDLLSSALPQITERLVDLQIRRRWPSIVGRDIARRSHPDGLTGGALRVAVDNSPWLHELKLREAELTAKVRERFPEVTSLRLTLGNVAPDGTDGTTPALRPTPLTAADRADIEAASASITDP